MGLAHFQHSAAKIVIKVISKRLGIDVDTSELDKLAHTINEQVKALEKNVFPSGIQGFQQEGLPGGGERPSYIR